MVTQFSPTGVALLATLDRCDHQGDVESRGDPQRAAESPALDGGCNTILSEMNPGTTPWQERGSIRNHCAVPCHNPKQFGL